MTTDLPPLPSQSPQGDDPDHAGMSAVRGRKYLQVLEGAREEMLVKGFERTSMDDVAARAGVSKATVYSYFESKDRMFEAVLNAEVDVMRAQIEQAAADRDVSTEDKFFRIGMHILTIKLSNRALPLFRALIAGAGRMPNLCQVINQDIRNQLRGAIGVAFEQARDEGMLQFDNVGEVLHFFSWLLNGDFLINTLIEPNAKAPEEHVLAAHVRWVVARLFDMYGTSSKKPR
jgi:AcrR family transcriptional regulator